MLKCSKCSQLLDESCFSKRPDRHRGYKSSCKSCNKKYRDSASEHISAQKKAYHSRPEVIIRRRARWKIYHARKMESDPQYRAMYNYRRRVQAAFKLAKAGKSASLQELVGCSWATYVSHIESQFSPGMDWKDNGKIWQVDHIKPCASFDLTKIEQQKQCFHYTNLQPLWAVDNLKKGSKFPFAE